MLGASVVGGYIGARLTQWLPPHVVRGFVVRRLSADRDGSVLALRSL